MQEQQNFMDTTAVSTLINRRGLLMALKSSGTGCLAFTLLQKTSRRLPMSMLLSRTHSMLLWPKAPSLCFLTTKCLLTPAGCAAATAVALSPGPKAAAHGEVGDEGGTAEQKQLG